jgi:hypothetical protein
MWKRSWPTYFSWYFVHSIHLRLNIRFLNNLVFTVRVCYPYAQPPTWRTRVSLFVWLLPLDLSGMGAPTSSYATAGIAHRVSGALKPHHHDMVETSSVGISTLLSFFITALYHISLYLILYMYIPTFCRCFLFLPPTVLITSMFKTSRPKSAAPQIFVPSHLNMWLQPFFFFCYSRDKVPVRCFS